MEIAKTVSAGSLESNDVLVVAHPNEQPGVVIEIQSIVQEQFGDQIRDCVKNMIEQLGVTRGVLQLNDHGALDYTIQARVETAVLRAAEENNA